MKHTAQQTPDDAAEHQGHRKPLSDEAARSDASLKDTAQSAQDAKEKRRHPASENTLDSSQDKNPIPPDSVKK
ncbi:hypothetical protein [Paraburkholderia phytofirmans]|uniref:Uncharacterized protein n=2 Tax=Paraburkholderia phytofirmans TaxID=261302 RepID=B2T4C7_PARPJ|nr:hypothetical protein [Paraburkholderia phytofirmans]ACD16438.1 hypothetical protein Bphyt_2031 [Paraburkholderia phytofirmans PsJN]